MANWPLSPVNTYYVLIGSLSFIAMFIDKRKSVKKRWRVPEKTLMTLAALGGALGIIAGMIVFRHKVRKPLFYLGAPALYLIHRAWITPRLIQLLIDVSFGW